MIKYTKISMTELNYKIEKYRKIDEIKLYN